MKKTLLVMAASLALFATTAVAQNQIASLSVVAKVPDSPHPELLKDGFHSLLDCNNYAISMMDERDAWCVAYDATGKEIVFKPRAVKYVYPNVEKKVDLRIEILPQ